MKLCLYHPLCHCQIDKRVESVVIIPVVETEAELVYVALHLLDRHMVVDAVDATFDDGPEALDAVGADAVAKRVCRGVVNLQADEILVVGSVKDVVTAELVRHDRGVVLADVLQNPEQLLA